MNRIFEIIGQSSVILRKKHLSLNKRLRLLISYLGLVLKRFVLHRLPGIDETTAHFLGYKIKVGKFSDFYWTFIEIFIKEDYFFTTDKQTPFIVDCGANIGIATLYFKWRYPGAKILAFEIEPDNLNILRFNLDVNKISGVSIINKAVGAEKGIAILRGNRRAGSISATLIEEQVKKDNSYNSYELQVEVTPLSQHINETVDFLKMDIEGAESSVYKELAKTGLMKKVEKTTLEFHRFSSNENRLSDIIRVFEDFNFDVIFPNNYKKLSQIKRSYYNYMIRAGQRKW